MEKEQDQLITDQEPPVAPAQAHQAETSGPPPYVVVTGMAQQPGVILNVQQPLVIYAEPIRDRQKSVVALGIMQIIAAVMFTGFGVATLFTHSPVRWVGSPIWTGLCFCLPAGICGIMSALSKPKRRCLAVASMVMSILASIGCLAVIGLASPALARYYRYGPAAVGLESCNIVIAVFEFIVSILAASYSCCCMIPNKSTATVPQFQANPVQYGTQVAPTGQPLYPVQYGYHRAPTGQPVYPVQPNTYMQPNMQPNQYAVAAPPQGLVR